MLITTAKHYFAKYASFMVLLLLTGACVDHEPQVEPDPLPIPAVNERLLLESDQSGKVQGIEYNADKTVKKYQSGLSFFYTVAYASNTVTYSVSVNGKVAQKNVFEIENKVAKKVIIYQVDNNGNETAAETVTYSYKTGRLVKEEYSGSLLEGHIEYHYDNLNENVSYTDTYKKNGVFSHKTSYEYTNVIDKSGSLSQEPGVADLMCGTFFPRKFKYLIKKRTIEGAVTEQSSFTYVLDQQGYVTSGTRTDDNGDVKSWTNTWQ